MYYVGEREDKALLCFLSFLGIFVVVNSKAADFWQFLLFKIFSKLPRFF